MPLAVLPKNPLIRQSSMLTKLPVPAPRIRMPMMPLSNPWKLMLRMFTVFLTSVAAKESKAMLMAFVPATRIELNTSWQSMVIDLVMVTAPKPPGSMQLISLFTAVFEMAPAKVLHGAVRLHGLASSPTPDTQVRLACALAGLVASARPRIAPASAKGTANKFFMVGSGAKNHSKRTPRVRRNSIRDQR